MTDDLENATEAWERLQDVGPPENYHVQQLTIDAEEAVHRLVSALSAQEGDDHD